VRIERRAPEPIIPLSLFKDKNFPLLLIVALTSGGVGIGLVNYHALFLQMTTGLSPTHAGLFFIAITGGIAMGSITAGRMIERTGRYKPFLITGTMLSVLALIAVSQIQVGTSLWVIGIVLMTCGLAIGLAQQSPVIGVQLIAPQADIGAATSAVTLCRMAGASLAISIYGAVLSARLLAGEGATPGVVNPATLSPEALADLPETSRVAVSILFSNAFTWLYMAAAGLAAIGLTAAFLLRPTIMPVRTEKRAS
jgi:MFS family permease